MLPEFPHCRQMVLRFHILCRLYHVARQSETTENFNNSAPADNNHDNTRQVTNWYTESCTYTALTAIIQVSLHQPVALCSSTSTSLKTEPHRIIGAGFFLQTGCPSCQPTNGGKATTDLQNMVPNEILNLSSCTPIVLSSLHLLKPKCDTQFE